MSKRFGRNQKRKLKADNDRWREAHMQAVKLAQRLRAQGERDAATVRRVSEVLGRHFAGLDPETISAECYGIPFIELPKTMSATDYVEQTSVMEPVEMSIVLDVLECYWHELCASALKDQVHALVEAPGGRVGYAASRSAVMNQDPEQVAEAISLSVREYLVPQISKMQREEKIPWLPRR